MTSKSDKFERKTDPKDVAKGYENSRKLQLKHMRKILPEQSELWQKVQGICLNNNLAPSLFAYYYAFASELYKKKRKFADKVLENEALNVQMDWIHKGLDSAILSKIGYAMGIPLDPAIEMIVTNLLNPHPVSLSTLLNPHPVSLATLLNPHPVSLSTLLNPHPVSLSTLLNPHPVSLASLPNPSNLDVALSLIKAKTDNLDVALSLIKAKTDNLDVLLSTRYKQREDLTSLGGVVSPNNAGVQIQAPSGSLKVKVYDAGFHGAVDGLHYFYFGTSTTATARRFCTINKLGLVHQTFVQPRVSNAADGLYLFSSVSETNMPYDVNYVIE